MRASRLLTTLLLLQVKGRVTARTLSEEFGVSVRTVYRDIDELSAAGVPVYAERGPGGGIALLEGYRNRLTGLTPGEVEALSLSGLEGPASELGIAGRLQDAQLKLAATFPESARGLSRISSRLHVDPVGWYRRPPAASELAGVAEAVWEQRRLSFAYGGWDMESARTIVVDPLGLVLKAGEWYLVARRDSATRIYKIANIQRAELTDEGFDSPAGFDLAAEWSDGVARFEAGLLVERARLRVSAEGAAQLDRLGAAAVAEAVFDAPGADGWREVTLLVERVESAAEQLLGFGPHVQVLEPEGLRRQLRRLAQMVVQLNGEAAVG